MPSTEYRLSEQPWSGKETGTTHTYGPDVYVCGVFVCVWYTCICVDAPLLMCRAGGGGHGVPCSITFHLIPQRQNLSLNLDSCWQPASPYNPSIAIHHMAGAPRGCEHNRLFITGFGIWTQFLMIVHWALSPTEHISAAPSLPQTQVSPHAHTRTCTRTHFCFGSVSLQYEKVNWETDYRNSLSPWNQKP